MNYWYRARQIECSHIPEQSAASPHAAGNPFPFGEATSRHLFDYSSTYLAYNVSHKAEHRIRAQNPLYMASESQLYFKDNINLSR